MRASRTRRCRGLGIGVLVAGLLFAIGCGSSDSGGSTTAKSGGARATQNLTVCFDGASPPQEYYASAHKPAGSEVEILQAIADTAHYKLTYHQLQFNGLIPALLSKQCDIVAAGMFVKPDRLKVIDFAIYSVNGQTIMVQKGNKVGITGYDGSLAGKTIGMTAGYATIPVVQKKCAEVGAGAKKPCKVVQFGNPTDTYQALKTGKVDSVIDATTSVAYFTSQNSSTFEIVKTPVLLPSDVGFGVRKGAGALLTSLRTGIDRLYGNGAMCKILTKWNIGATARPPHSC